MEYRANGGQTCLPVDALRCPYGQWTPVPRPDPLLPLPEINPQWKEKGFFLAFPPVQHFLPNVTAEMLDWFWVNMEKCYYLWAPGSHKYFQWIKEPWKYGFVGSRLAIAENNAEEAPCFIVQSGADDACMQRLDMDRFPLDYALEHVLMEAMGVGEGGEVLNNNIHMWQDVDGGCVHITAFVLSKKCLAPGETLEERVEKEAMRAHPEGAAFSHQDLECSHWPVFLPPLYQIWKDHPDPCQNVKMDLSVEQIGDYRWRYIHKNDPVI